MKRDMELVRLILADFEENSTGSPYFIDPRKFPYDPPSVDMHCDLLIKHGFAEGQRTSNGWFFKSVTWDGYDFLDNSRETVVWTAAKKVAGGFSIDVFKKVLIEIATRYAMSLIQGF